MLSVWLNLCLHSCLQSTPLNTLPMCGSCCWKGSWQPCLLHLLLLLPRWHQLTTKLRLRQGLKLLRARVDVCRAVLLCSTAHAHLHQVPLHRQQVGVL